MKNSVHQYFSDSDLFPDSFKSLEVRSLDQMYRVAGRLHPDVS